ncbi:MAG: ABC transporter substrate-binding protein [Desulfobacterium sp.]|nr:ABC transporter substrate-binding protein [Desulfobacterium sp.]
MHETKIRSFSLFLILSIAFISCGPEMHDRPLRLGTNIWLGYEPLYLAREMNFFDKNPIRLVEATSNSEVIQAFRNNALDAAALTLDEVLLLAQSGIDLRVILIIDFSHGADVIMGQPGLAGFKDVKGKRIGVENTAVGAYMLARALQMNGLTQEDVYIVPLEINEHERAFVEKKIDAIVTFEPVYSKLLVKGGQKLFDSSLIPGEIVDVLIVRTEYLQKNRQKVNTLFQGWFQALAYLEERPNDAAAVMTARLGITVDQVLKSLNGLRFPDQTENRQMISGTGGIIIETGENLIRFMREQNLLRKQIDMASLIENGRWE